MAQLNHQHMVGTAYLKNPPTTVEQANKWLKTLVEKINMEILMGPFSIDCVTEGNEGITGIIVLSTSHSSFHCWHLVENPFMTFDVYSCKSFSIDVIFNHMAEFEPEKIDYMVIDRNNAYKLINQGTHVPNNSRARV